jgi:hypothetical protein
MIEAKLPGEFHAMSAFEGAIERKVQGAGAMGSFVARMPGKSVSDREGAQEKVTEDDRQNNRVIAPAQTHCRTSGGNDRGRVERPGFVLGGIRR